jgi:hypothetical protein
MEQTPKCLHCGKTDETIPLVNLTYKGQMIWICSEHLPLLIHDRQKIAAQIESALKSEE